MYVQIRRQEPENLLRENGERPSYLVTFPGARLGVVNPQKAFSFAFWSLSEVQESSAENRSSVMSATATPAKVRLSA